MKARTTNADGDEKRDMDGDVDDDVDDDLDVDMDSDMNSDWVATWTAYVDDNWTLMRMKTMQVCQK